MAAILGPGIDPALLVLVRFIHIAAGVVWVGGIVYAGLVVGRTMMDAPPQVRGPAMGRIGPAGFTLLNWAGIVTIVFGILNEYLITRVTDNAVGSQWHMVLGFGILASVAMLGIGHGMIKPSLRKMAAAAASPTPPDPAQMAAVQKRLMIAGMLGIALGMISVFLMVWATRMRAGP